MIVVDASAAISALLGDGPARRRVGAEQLHATPLVDVEVADGLRKLALRSAISDEAATAALSGWAQLAVHRHPVLGFLGRMWELRHNLSAYDASYVALAEALGCNLLTADRRLAAATGPQCAIEIVPR